MFNKFTQIKTAPSVLAVSVADFKQSAKINTAEDDSLIEKFIKSATNLCERFMGRPILNTTYIQSQDNFDNLAKFDNGVLTRGTYYIKTADNYIGLARKGLKSVVSVKLYDYEDTETILASDKYRVDEGANRIYLNTNFVSPTLRGNTGIITEYVAGYGATANDIPQDIKDAIIMLAQEYYELNRSKEMGQVVIPPLVKEILNFNKNYDLGGS